MYNPQKTSKGKLVVAVALLAAAAVFLYVSYLATHAYFELMGGIASQLVVKKWADTSNSIDGHFWVEKQTGEIVDLTKDQYPTGFKHYSEGIISKKGPSKKANNFTQIVRESLKRKAQN